MKFEIKHRTTAAVLFSLECSSLKLCLEAAVSQKADLRGADLGGAYLRGARLDGANLRGANLRGACLDGADLDGADLRGAYLDGACLGGANLRGIIQLGFPDGFVAWAIAEKDTNRLLITVGCHRDEPLSQGRAYWSDPKHPHSRQRRGILVALDYAEAVAKLRGWVIT